MRPELPQFQPRDPNYAERVRTSFGLQQAMSLIGAEMAQVEPGYVEIHLPHKAAITQQHGFIHGGVVGMIAVLTVEYKMNLVAPADGQRLVARGEVVRPGRTLIVTRADVYAIRDEQWTLCAIMQQTIMVMHGKKEREG